MAAPATVMITGGAGNLGQKLAAHLSAREWCRRVLLVDRVAASCPAKAEAVVSDLGDANAPAWQEALAAADAVVHFAAANPYPDCTWAEAARSFDMTANLLARKADRARRFVFASSNHVMGGYKEDDPGPGALTTDLPPKPGTRFYLAGGYRADAAYATAKLMGERALLAAAAASGGNLTGVALRIGWCQPGENHPRTISGDGLPDAEHGTGYDGRERDMRWFRAMWLSNGDFVRAVECALTADAGGWPAPGIVVNAMSANAGMPWEIETARRLTGYAPVDDVWTELG